MLCAKICMLWLILGIAGTLRAIMRGNFPGTCLKGGAAYLSRLHFLMEC